MHENWHKLYSVFFRGHFSSVVTMADAVEFDESVVEQRALDTLKRLKETQPSKVLSEFLRAGIFLPASRAAVERRLRESKNLSDSVDMFSPTYEQIYVSNNLRADAAVLVHNAFHASWTVVSMLFYDCGSLADPLWYDIDQLLHCMSTWLALPGTTSRATADALVHVLGRSAEFGTIPLTIDLDMTEPVGADDGWHGRIGCEDSFYKDISIADAFVAMAGVRAKETVCPTFSPSRLAAAAKVAALFNKKAQRSMYDQANMAMLEAAREQVELVDAANQLACEAKTEADDCDDMGDCDSAKDMGDYDGETVSGLRMRARACAAKAEAMKTMLDMLEGVIAA
jgi:hypothetical protein